MIAVVPGAPTWEPQRPKETERRFIHGGQSPVLSRYYVTPSSAALSNLSNKLGTGQVEPTGRAISDGGGRSRKAVETERDGPRLVGCKVHFSRQNHPPEGRAKLHQVADTFELGKMQLRAEVKSTDASKLR